MLYGEEPGELSRYSDSLRTGRSGDRVPVVARFSAPIRTGSEANPAFCTMGTRSFPGVKRAGRGVDHPPPSSAVVKERVELYLYSLTGLSWPVIRWSLPLMLYGNGWWKSMWLRGGNRFVECEVTKGRPCKYFVRLSLFMDVSHEQLEIGIDVWYRCAPLTFLCIWFETF
jgi:hypothetical protein